MKVLWDKKKFLPLQPQNDGEKIKVTVNDIVKGT